MSPHLMEMLEMAQVTARILPALPKLTSGLPCVACAMPPGILHRLTTMLSATSSRSWHMAMWAAVCKAWRERGCVWWL